MERAETNKAKKEIDGLLEKLKNSPSDGLAAAGPLDTVKTGGADSDELA